MAGSLPFDDDSFAIDTCLCFGLASSAGIHGIMGDAGEDLLRARGIGPLLKWVDYHLFFRLRRDCIDAYNSFRKYKARTIIEQRGAGSTRSSVMVSWRDVAQRQTRGMEDSRFPLQNFPPRMPNHRHAYTIEDIDDYSAYLGIPWQQLKDLPFDTTTIYLIWDLVARTITLSDAKKAKNLKADIRWAEAVAFELLIHAVSRRFTGIRHFRILGDNRGVVEGWWIGRSRSRHINEIFRRIHGLKRDLEYQSNLTDQAIRHFISDPVLAPDGLDWNYCPSDKSETDHCDSAEPKFQVKDEFFIIREQQF
ncbi:hypothetical protein AX15_007402 [Amanita polypyramis BW_CC]|nr:hypothetical protein AX15_007402 [Amanita polypyramis BW_CC]